MNIFNNIRYYKGYLTIKVEGLYLEKFLNMAVMNGVNFWDIKRIDMTSLQLKISIKDYKSLKLILRKTGCKASIIDKEGLPFFIYRLKKRKMLGIGFVAFVILVFVLSSFIWSVKIIGAKTVSTGEVKKYLSELGVRPGVFKPSIAVAEIENNMLIKMGSISWIKLKIIGTRAEVEIVERVPPPKVLPKDVPCNIVAKKDGIITKIVSQMGEAVVKQDEPVKKGQLLVNGVISPASAEIKYVHSIAEVKARTWYDKKVVVPLEYVEKVRSGNKKIKIYAVFGSNKYIVKNSNISYKNYDKIERSIKPIDLDIFQLPVEFIIEEYYETINKTVIMSKEEAKLKAAEEAEKIILNSIPSDAKIMNKSLNISYKDNVVIADIFIETVEDIGEQEEITK